MKKFEVCCMYYYIKDVIEVHMDVLYKSKSGILFRYDIADEFTSWI